MTSLDLRGFLFSFFWCVLSRGRRSLLWLKGEMELGVRVCDDGGRRSNVVLRKRSENLSSAIVDGRLLAKSDHKMKSANQL